MKQKDKTEDKIRICFVGDLSLSFVKKDHELLEKHFAVDVVQPPKKRNLSWLKYILALAGNIFQSDLSFCWFAGWHSVFAIFLARLLRKKSIIVAGGFDCACVPEIGYGAFLKGKFLKEGLPAKYVFKNAYEVLVADLSLKSDIIKNAKTEGSNIKHVPTGYDSNHWRPKGRKESIVLAVGTGTEPVIRKKGFDTFVKVAKYFPSINFVLVGRHIDRSTNHLKNTASSNVKFTGFVSDGELHEYYQKAKVYCQLSRYEGLADALCEAMLCKCIPVGTRYCGIPTAIGDTGFYVEYGNDKSTAEAIKKALDAPGGLGEKARQRIKEMFPLEKREKEMERLVAEVLADEEALQVLRNTGGQL